MCRTCQAFTHLDKPQMRWPGVHHILKESEGKRKKKGCWCPRGQNPGPLASKATTLTKTPQ